MDASMWFLSAFKQVFTYVTSDKKDSFTYLYGYMCVSGYLSHMCGYPQRGGEKKLSEPYELELQVVCEPPEVGVGNQTLVLCKNSKCF